MVTCRLVKRDWLYRCWEIGTDEGAFRVEYRGRGAGYEAVIVSGPSGSTTLQCASTLWFVPRFAFEVGSRRATLEVTVRPWMALSKVELWIAGELVYAEGAGAQAIGAAEGGKFPIPATDHNPSADVLPLPAGEQQAEEA